MDSRDCRAAGTPTVQQYPVDPKRIVPDGAVSILRLCGRHDSAEDEPHFGTGRGGWGGRSCLSVRRIVQPPGRATAANDTQNESNEDNPATSPCRREPVEQRRSSGTKPQDVPLRCRDPLRGFHARKICDARCPVQVPSLATRTPSGRSRAPGHRSGYQSKGRFIGPGPPRLCAEPPFEGQAFAGDTFGVVAAEQVVPLSHRDGGAGGLEHAA